MDQFVDESLTWYESTAVRTPTSQSLSSHIQVDVCIIGGGLAGLTAAVELSGQGLQVVLLEARRIAWGASGRNGGFVSNGFAESIDTVAKRVGVDAARQLYALSCEGTEYVRQSMAENNPRLKMGDGWTVFVRHHDKGGLRAHVDKMNTTYGEQLVYLAKDAVQRAVTSPKYQAGSNSPTAFHIHPLHYSLMLAEKARRSGVVIYENSPALAIETAGAALSVRTAVGRVDAKHVIHCVSALDRRLHPLTGQALLPVATYIAVTEPLQQSAIRTGSALSDTRRAGDYYRLIDEGRLLWGGRITTRIQRPAKLAELMAGDIAANYPSIGRPRIDYAWAGIMGYALHKMPLIGRDGSRQWFALGFGGHGLNTTAMAGLLIARAISQGDDSYRRFAAFAPDWAYGQLGRLGVQGSYWYMQLKDRLEEIST